ncbi:hypothetical protein MAJ_11448, partial [Metarhizium majus ARSEF 297]
MDQQALQQQPDFTAAARALEVVVDNVRLCSNIPAVDSGAAQGRRMDAIMEQLVLLNQKLDALDAKVDALDAKVDALDAKVDTLDAKVIASDKNSRARVANSIVISPLMELTPMHNVRTGEEISGCPATLGQLEEMSMQELARLLRELGEPVPRAERERKRLVKLAFGLRTREV